MAFINKGYYEFKNWVVFILILIFYLLATFYTNRYILIESIYQNSFSTQFSYSKINQLFSFAQRWQWIGLIFLPVLFFCGVGYATLCLSIGCYLSSFKIRIRDIFRIVLLAEICLAIGVIIRIIWLTFMHINTLTDIQYFSPLSLAQLLGPKDIPKYLLYLCQTINIFEIAYWLVLAAGLTAFLEKPFGKMFKLVMSSYGVGLLLWIVFVSYLTVTFSA